ncbi:RNA 3'-terminal phosphate cyclase [Blastomyces silverae]|uniref:RNA 3'-terminal phosphate cyclase n=1 Tax=Blastomyces silverae TaxID=2060906 RepID=A0A0H1BHL8_9EURO|nr:RNA 3'-terminal phosphate cyclase [Blastomyces silverae]
MLHLDGSTLEGGGQLVRNAVALSALTGRPVTISNIRGKRNGPRGLRRSHTAAIQFLAEVCGGRIVGATVGSSEITFYPRDTEDANLNSAVGEDEAPSILQKRARLRPISLALPIQSEYTITLTTPGSIFLIFQALYPYLMYAGARLHRHGEGVNDSSVNRVIKLNITGGTNISFSPSYDYVSQVLIPSFARLGLPRLSVKLNRRGWSTGAVQIGSVSFEIEPLAISSASGVTGGQSDTKEAGQKHRIGCPKQEPAAGNPRRESSGETESSLAFSLRFPLISLENLDPGYITKVDITVLAPDTSLSQGAALRHSKKAHHRKRKNGKYMQHGTNRSKKHYFKGNALSEPEFVEEDESEGLGPSISGDRGFYESPGLESVSIRGFLEDAAMKSVTKALRVFSDNNPRASKQPSPNEAPIVRIHTTEPTYDPSHIYLLLVAHTSTGFRLGRGQLYSECQSVQRNKACRNRSPKEQMETLFREMVNECVAGLMEEFLVTTDARTNDIPKMGTKGCLDTFTRDQVVVFQALGALDEDMESCESGNQSEEEGLSLHSRTAMWVSAQVLGVRV